MVDFPRCCWIVFRLRKRSSTQVCTKSMEFNKIHRPPSKSLSKLTKRPILEHPIHIESLSAPTFQQFPYSVSNPQLEPPSHPSSLNDNPPIFLPPHVITPYRTQRKALSTVPHFPTSSRSKNLVSASAYPLPISDQGPRLTTSEPSSAEKRADQGQRQGSKKFYGKERTACGSLRA